MESIWSKTADLPPYPALDGDRAVQAAVIGGGMAGILTAYRLKELGVPAVVLEGSRVGSGQTGNTTAKITSQHNLIYERLIRQFGAEKARQYAGANQHAVAEYRRIAEQLGIDCQLEERPACLYAAREEAVPRLKQEAAAARELGIPARFVTETSLPFPVAGGVVFPGQAQFHPLLFLRGICRELTIFEHTAVKQVEGHRILTDRGTVTAEQIVFATHFPFVNRPGYYFARMHQERSYVLALEGAPGLDGMYLGTDGEGLSFRSSGKYLLLGGGGHRTGENRAGGKYELLRAAASRWFPGCPEVARWSAQDCMPLDGVPYIGPFSPAAPGWYVATGFGKWGMTGSMVSALLLGDLITHRQNPWAPVFSPQRFTPAASAVQFLTESGTAVTGLSKEFLVLPRVAVEGLPRGHGGIVEHDGKKVGVYKDEEDRLFFVSTRCPHLGCQLTWNPDEKSWDCPCHGSRFDYRGRLIDNPAQEDLEGADLE